MDRYQLLGYAILILSAVPASLITRSNTLFTLTFLLAGIAVLIAAAFAPVVHLSRKQMILVFAVAIGGSTIGNLILYYCYFIYLPCGRLGMMPFAGLV